MKLITENISKAASTFSSEGRWGEKAHEILTANIRKQNSFIKKV